MIKVVHLITGLSTGGAEMMLYKLVSRMDRTAFDVQVISLTDIGPVGDKIQALGVPVRALGMRRGVPNPLTVLRLAGWLRRDPPDVIQTWMYHADLIGALAAKLAGGIPVVWGIRHSNLDPQVNKGSTIWTARACAHLSHLLPTRIVCCSEASHRVHRELGYTANKMVVIPNGFDLDAYRPDLTARRSVRQDLGIPEGAPVIGLIGRFHPLKDHHNFIKAAARLHTRLPDIHFLLCGDGITWDNRELAGWIDAAGIRSCCHLLGRREDIVRVTAALDIAVSSSCGEGFPNVIGEAMACGVPCVVTDVGDSAFIVGDTGRVVPPREPQALVEACHELIEAGPETRSQLGLAARQRVQERFSLPTVVARFEGLYRELASNLKRNVSMNKPNTTQDRENSTPLWKLWLTFFAYAAGLALVVQLVVLPYIFPAWHMGNGLMIGGDWLYHHRLAVELAQKIETRGWSAWELRPEGQAPAGLAGAIYALAVPEPWTLIPINAALYATAGLILLRMIQIFIPNWRLAIWCVLPFLLYPSAMIWYTQILKDGYSITGSLLFLYGWILLSRLGTWRSGWWPPLRAVLWVFVGAAIAWIVRPYLVQMMQGVGVILSLLLTGAFLARAARAVLPWREVVAALLLVWAVVVLITPLTRGGITAEVPSGEAVTAAPPAGAGEEEPIITVAWERSGWLPAFLDNKLYAMAVIRKRFRILYPDAASHIDINRDIHNAREFVAYIPRALQVAFLSPFPKQWFEKSSLPANMVMRRVSALEMTGVYLTLAFLPYALWRWRRRVEPWVILAFCTGMMLIFALTVPNIGSLYRVRYGYIMTLVALGIAAGIAVWQESRLSRRGRC